MATLLDTTVLIDILEGNPGVTGLLDRLEDEALFTTRINVFEVLVGVYALKRHMAQRLEQADRLFARLHILDLGDAAARKAAQLQGSLYQQGKPIDDTDCLTAAIGLVNGITQVVTRNKKHFEPMRELNVESY